MSKAVLNIGLNIGTVEPTKQLQNVFMELEKIDFIVRNVKIVNGHWLQADGLKIEERTLVVETTSKVFGRLLQLNMEYLANQLHQDSIAVREYLDSEVLDEYLAYDSDWKGYRQEFKSEFFTDFN